MACPLFGAKLFSEPMLAACQLNIFEHISIKHDDVIKLRYFPRYWPFVWGIHGSRKTMFYDLILKSKILTK